MPGGLEHQEAWYGTSIGLAFIKYYDKILKVKPAKKIFAAGWRNRAEAV